MARLRICRCGHNVDIMPQSRIPTGRKEGTTSHFLVHTRCPGVSNPIPPATSAPRNIFLGGGTNGLVWSITWGKLPACPSASRRVGCAHHIFDLVGTAHPT